MVRCKNNHKYVVLIAKLCVKKDGNEQNVGQTKQASLITAATLYTFILLLDYWYPSFHILIL